MIGILIFVIIVYVCLHLWVGAHCRECVEKFRPTKKGHYHD